MVSVGLFLNGWNVFRGRTHQHQTRVGQYYLSPLADIINGVIQGSGIGPVMFLVYIDDFAQLLERHGVTVKLFADDVKVYLQIVDVMVTSKLQCALDIIVEWATIWQLHQVSVNKCNMLSIGRTPFATEYHICDSVLPVIINVGTLG